MDKPTYYPNRPPPLQAQGEELTQEYYRDVDRPRRRNGGLKFLLSLAFIAILAGVGILAYRFGLMKVENERLVRAQEILQETLQETATPIAPPPAPPPIVEPPPPPIIAPVVIAPPPPPPPPVVPIARVSAAELNALLTRARSAIQNGDISLARSVLERAILAEDAQAFLLLGETYDTNRLKEWNARGVRADSQRAKTLYERALAAGELTAKTRLETLK